ncbi:hypothetical protein [Magnetospirillum gryphiswaldense]|uniref:Uncharacterized protein n=2 Tax=Magnetospirillum gryphiswaldense TaxID=55518 RepID=V6F0B7_MAGGM|nr:hypothetical protein [Magnetospirillum gryphiswaldense]AVM74183.1 hypothetical protein MSR1_16910 [Magnetospirillum gryphiswaldense MSR-1]AVM78086.1 hypothetical protein MSR1L_16910 [Magnetospirillum gryphiswaldense]CAM75834.1 conserved hypothetical protein [Magnetospirillum gryphiswaldense MSR-1]CDK97741.1 protein of unknown function [Magnetospirillum gryphiswaldense MSR-1 v2]
MHQLLSDMRRLSELLEAECADRPFDRSQAHTLASHLAETCPEMGQTMRRISDRMRGEAR